MEKCKECGKEEERLAWGLQTTAPVQKGDKPNTLPPHLYEYDFCSSECGEVFSIKLEKQGFVSWDIATGTNES